jgi:hypothetical protein
MSQWLSLLLVNVKLRSWMKYFNYIYLATNVAIDSIFVSCSLVHKALLQQITKSFSTEPNTYIRLKLYKKCGAWEKSLLCRL